MALHDGDTFEHEGARFRVTFQPDDTQDTPWEREDGHGPVSDWRKYGRARKAAGERVLCADRGAVRFYDFAEAVKIARRDRWGAPEGHFRADAMPTRGQIAAAAAEADFKRLADWCADRWSYVGCIVTLLDDFGDPIEDASASLWGIESDAGDYFDEVVRELADDVIATVRTAAGKVAA